MEDKESIEELMELAKALAEMKQECLESENQFKAEDDFVLLEADTKYIGTIKSEPFASEKLAEAKEDPFLSPKQRLVSCSFCEKPFSRLDQLRDHERVHTGEKPFECSKCARQFSTSVGLKSHEKFIHIRKKLYSCSKCDKSFINAGNLKVHLRIHSDEKMYGCSKCGERFKHLDTLKKHDQTHTGLKSFSCMKCGMSFTTSGNLKIHERNHTNAQMKSLLHVQNVIKDSNSLLT